MNREIASKYLLSSSKNKTLMLDIMEHVLRNRIRYAHKLIIDFLHYSDEQEALRIAKSNKKAEG